MIDYNLFVKTAGLASLIILLSTLVACGGGGNKKKEECELPGVFIFIAVCWDQSSGSTQSKQDVSSKSDSMPTGADNVPPTFDIVDEYEPNNSLDNANIVAIQTKSNNGRVEVEVNGNVQTSADTADNFIFTPNRTATYDILLCGDTCREVLQDDVVYLMIYDQNQTTIASTPMGGEVTQKLTLELATGVAYYIEVNGYNTTDANYAYRLVITN